MGPNDFYTMFQLEGHNSAAAYTQREDETQMGVPPHWNLYICVQSADAAVKRAAELGGQALAGPFDVSTHGRMAVIRDPSGAVFCIWEPGDNTGLEVEGQNASFCWADLSTPDQQAAVKFYSALFGWTFPRATRITCILRTARLSSGAFRPLSTAIRMRRRIG
jgi:predicted enzyme related to lactoylglutathione lyase